MSPEPKDPFAQALARRRWDATPPEERSRINAAGAATRLDRMTKRERRAYFRALARKRWPKKPKVTQRPNARG